MSIIPYVNNLKQHISNNITINKTNKYSEILQSFIYELEMYINDYEEEQRNMCIMNLFNKYANMLSQTDLQYINNYFLKTYPQITNIIKNYLFL